MEVFLKLLWISRLSNLIKPISQYPKHGIQAAFDDEQCNMSLTREKVYRAGCNFFWLNLHRSLMPGVPLSMDRIKDVVAEFWQKPRPFKGMVNVEAKSDGGLPRKSNLLIMSPEEFCHVYLLAIDASIERGDSEDVLNLWKKYCLSVCFEYVDVSANGYKATFWWSWNNREQHCATSDAVKRTAYQRACEVNAFKTTLERQKLPSTADAIAKAYSDAAATKKNFDASYIRECLAVYEKICLNPEITAVMDRLEKKFGIESCLNSLSKLNKIIEKCDTNQQRVLVFHAIEDAIERQLYSNTRFTREFLTGGPRDNGSQIPFVMFVIFKWRLRHHVLTVEMPREKLNSRDIQTITEKTANYAVYRCELNEHADTTWIGAMEPSSVLALRVVQDAFKFMLDCPVNRK